MNPRDKVALIIAIGTVSLIGAVVIGGLFISHSQDREIHTEILTIIKMSMTGLISILSYYMGYKSAQKEQE